MNYEQINMNCVKELIGHELKWDFSTGDSRT